MVFIYIALSWTGIMKCLNKNPTTQDLAVSLAVFAANVSLLISRLLVLAEISPSS